MARMSLTSPVHILRVLGGKKIIWLISAFSLLGAVYAVTTPLFEISDELWHYPLVKHLADGSGLPVQDPAVPTPWRQEGSQPPLYYALMALATRWIDTSDMDQVRWLNPHVDNGIITEDRNNNILIHTERENWPWRGTVLAVRLIRLLSVLLGAGTVYFTYRLALELAPEQHTLALAAAGFAAFTPMFVFISASVNNDNLAILFSAWALGLMACWLRKPLPTLRQCALMGAVLGGAALSKVSALGLFPLAGAAMVYAYLKPTGLLNGRRIENQGRKTKAWFFVLRLVAIFGIALAVCGWWYWRNYQLYGDWLGWNRFIDIVGRRPHPATLAQLWGERVGFVQAYWGLFGGVSVPMPDWTYTLLNAMAGLALIGLIVGVLRAAASRRVTLDDTARWSLPVVWIALILIGLVRWTSLTWASQGRLIFPAISAVSVLAVVGLTQLARAFRLPPSAFILPAVLFMALLSAAVPFTVTAPHYAPPPNLTPAQVAAIPHRVNADFGGEITLLGYDLETVSVLPGESARLTLYWRSEIQMDRNWSIFVHVTDDQGVIVAQRDRYPAQGAFATTLLHPGQTFADRYVIQIPGATYSPVSAHIEVGLYDLTDGARAQLAAGGDALTLAPLDVRARADATPNALHQNFDNLIQLVGYDVDTRALRPGETLHLTLYWQALAPIRLNYSVFTHVRGEGETLWAGQDAWPQKGAAPTSTWRIGQIITDTYELTLNPDTPPGQYDVEVGLYDSATLQRLLLIEADGRPSDADFIYLSKIRVVTP